jgi:predicted HicB family RNase H-like nuclease
MAEPTVLEYRGYQGCVEYDQDAGSAHGFVRNIRDVITFRGRTPDELQAAFRTSVDDYLAFCAERGEPPETPTDDLAGE